MDVSDKQLIADVSRDLARDEGRKKAAYRDHLGFLTIGVGILIDERRGGGLLDEEIDFILSNRIRLCAVDLERLPAWRAVQGDPVRMRALINMRFQLGSVGIRGFSASLGHIAGKRWADAGRNLRKSLWYRQTPERAERVIRMIETGKA